MVQRKEALPMPVASITADKLNAKWQSGEPVDVIDVRTPAEYQEVHAPCARLTPLDQLDPVAVMKGRNGTAGRPLYLICRSGSRAKQAGERFIAAGFPNVVVVEGGTLAWEQAGCPVIRGPKTISLERQVRIAAGALVVLGSVLSLAVDEWFAVLAAFVGAGLIFAGITDTCGMALLLARLPWNRRKNGNAHCSTG
jgi:rhodanese-related sulfurtransferase